MFNDYRLCLKLQLGRSSSDCSWRHCHSRHWVEHCPIDLLSENQVKFSEKLVTANCLAIAMVMDEGTAPVFIIQPKFKWVHIADPFSHQKGYDRDGVRIGLMR